MLTEMKHSHDLETEFPRTDSDRMGTDETTSIAILLGYEFVENGR